jgi:hypothetical protein
LSEEINAVEAWQKTLFTKYIEEERKKKKTSDWRVGSNLKLCEILEKTIF